MDTLHHHPHSLLHPDVTHPHELEHTLHHPHPHPHTLSHTHSHQHHEEEQQHLMHHLSLPDVEHPHLLSDQSAGQHPGLQESASAEAEGEIEDGSVVVVEGMRPLKRMRVSDAKDMLNSLSSSHLEGGMEDGADYEEPKKPRRQRRKLAVISGVEAREDGILVVGNTLVTSTGEVSMDDDKRNFKCEACDHECNNRWALASHIRAHTGIKPYKCQHPGCDASFTQKGNLTTHMRIHQGEKRFECSECHKQFARKDGLLSHVRIHSGSKPFPCPTCGLSFKQKGTLTTHIRTHTGDKPFACPSAGCDKRFNQKSALTTHCRIHTGEKPYACPSCDKLFKQKGQLLRHVRIHSGTKPFECKVPLCGRVFTRRDNLLKHQRAHASATSSRSGGGGREEGKGVTEAAGGYLPAISSVVPAPLFLAPPVPAVSVPCPPASSCPGPILLSSCPGPILLSNNTGVTDPSSELAAVLSVSMSATPLSAPPLLLATVAASGSVLVAHPADPRDDDVISSENV